MRSKICLLVVNECIQKKKQPCVIKPGGKCCYKHILQSTLHTRKWSSLPNLHSVVEVVIGVAYFSPTRRRVMYWGMWPSTGSLSSLSTCVSDTLRVRILPLMLIVQSSPPKHIKDQWHNQPTISSTTQTHTCTSKLPCIGKFFIVKIFLSSPLTPKIKPMKYFLQRINRRVLCNCNYIYICI